jgi:hypothetical protein
MKPSSIRFTQLRHLLDDLGFSEVRQEAGWRFEHDPSETVFLFRPYRPGDPVYEHDLLLVRSQLDWRGLMPADQFDDSLKKTPA